MRRAARRDANEPEIIAALTALGAHVEQLSQDGVPDLLISYRRRLYLMEVIGPAKAKRYRATGGLTPAQVKWHRRFVSNPLASPLIFIAYNVQEAAQMIICTAPPEKP